MDDRDDFLDAFTRALSTGKRPERPRYQPADMHHDYDADTDTWRDQTD